MFEIFRFLLNSFSRNMQSSRIQNQLFPEKGSDIWKINGLEKAKTKKN